MSGSATPALSVEAVAKVFETRGGRVEAIAGIAFSVAPGEFIAILGPSGCGKTTLLRMIGGLERPSGGDIRIGARPLWAGGKTTREGADALAFAFQEPRLFPWFTIADNIALPLRLRGVPAQKRRARAAELAELVGLKGFENARPRQLSGGMRQRASLARALAIDPTILLLDEPFGALDAMTRDQMNLELQRIGAASGATVILITHSIAEAVFLSDRVVVLTPRPSRVQAIHTIDLPRPRAIAMQEDSAFQALVRGIRDDIAGYPS